MASQLPRVDGRAVVAAVPTSTVEAHKAITEVCLHKIMIQPQTRTEDGKLLPSIYYYPKNYSGEVSGSENVMICGFKHFHYEDVMDMIRKAKLLRTYIVNFHASTTDELPTGRAKEELNPYLIRELVHDKPWENRAKIDQKIKREITRGCKNSIVEWLLSNYIRSLSNLPPIQIYFCVAADDQNPIFPQDIASKASVLITPSELRRLYKMLKLLKDTGHDQLTQLIEKNVHFVSVSKKAETIDLTEVPSIIQDPRWTDAWNERMKQKSGPSESSKKPIWAEKLLKMADEISKIFKSPWFEEYNKIFLEYCSDYKALHFGLCVYGLQKYVRENHKKMFLELENNLMLQAIFDERLDFMRPCR